MMIGGMNVLLKSMKDTITDNSWIYVITLKHNNHSVSYLRLISNS
jgi:hypothetical protein